VTDIQIALLIGLILLNLLVTAIRAGLLNARYPRLISLGESENKSVEKTVELFTNRTKTRSTLRVTQTILRFLIAGLALSNFISGISYALLLAILLGTAIAIWLSEFIVERRIMREPEIWAVRLTSIANILIYLLSPILALPLHFSR
jgi:CBS domain containing-hemolysin-like protein